MKILNAKYWIILCLLLAACVTEKKQEDDTQFLRATPDSSSGAMPTKISIHCNIQYGKTKKPAPCPLVNVKITNLTAKSITSESSFKGGAGSVIVGRDVYALDVSTSNCNTVRNFKGIMAGMGVEANFEAPCGTK